MPDGRVVNGSISFAMVLNRVCDGGSGSPWVLEIAWPPGTMVRTRSDPSVVRQYLSPPTDAGSPALLGEPAKNTQPPSDVAFTGYRHGRKELWVAPSDDETYVYIKQGNAFERWARSAALFACI